MRYMMYHTSPCEAGASFGVFGVDISLPVLVDYCDSFRNGVRETGPFPLQ